MNKRAARKQALEGKLSIGDLRAMIEQAKSSDRLMSLVNPGIPFDRAIKIYEAAIDGRADDEIPKVWRRDPYSRTGRKKPTGDAILITNIVRDCA